MSRISELKQQFSYVFTDEQATVLAEVFHSSHNDLVKSSDFKHLTSVVSELAVAQTETQIELRNLAKKVGELSEAQKRTELKVEELSISQKELSISQKELSISQKELSISLAETQKEVRNLAKQVGGLSEAFGGSLEEFALDLVPELLEKYWNLKIISCSREEINYENKSIEFDLYIEGFIKEKKTIVLGEVKSHITKEEVLKFYKLVEKVKPIYADADLKVVFFGYRAYREVRELIDSLGGYMIFSNTKKL